MSRGSSRWPVGSDGLDGETEERPGRRPGRRAVGSDGIDDWMEGCSNYVAYYVRVHGNQLQFFNVLFLFSEVSLELIIQRIDRSLSLDSRPQ